MKTIKLNKLNTVMATLFATVGLLLSVPEISNAHPGQGWDVFKSGAANEGAGEPILTSGKGYLGTSMKATRTGQGWDVFNSRATNEGVGEPIPMSSKAYRGTSLEAAPSGDSDAFGVGAR